MTSAASTRSGIGLRPPETWILPLTMQRAGSLHDPRMDYARPVLTLPLHGKAGHGSKQAATGSPTAQPGPR